jgi:HEAT repeat protein
MIINGVQINCRHLFPALLALPLVGVTAWLLFGSHYREPVYKGKPLRSWLDLYSVRSTRSPLTDFTQANEAVRSAGTNAIPILLRMLRAKDSPLKLKLAALAQRQHLIKLQAPVPAEERNRQAAMGLQALGNSAASAVPAAIQIYEARLSPSSERWSSYALGAIGPTAKQAIPALLRGATNANPQSRQNSLIALASIHTEPALVVAALTNAFRDQNADVRLWACDRFGLLGDEASAARWSARAALEPLLRDPDPRVRGEAAAVLRKIDSHAEGAASNPSSPPR